MSALEPTRGAGHAPAPLVDAREQVVVRGRRLDALGHAGQGARGLVEVLAGALVGLAAAVAAAADERVGAVAGGVAGVAGHRRNGAPRAGHVDLGHTASTGQRNR